jgi:hypothetical protein
MQKVDHRRPLAIVGLIGIALVASLSVATAASSPLTRTTTINCPFLKNGRLTISVPANRKSLPKIDFDYDSKATMFSFRDRNLFLVAVDEEHPSRIRIIVSAQLNRKSGTYDGQIFTDTGGNQYMQDNGQVHCTVGR